MEIKQKIDSLLRQRKEIDNQISQLEYELVQKEQIKFSQLVGKYIKKCTDTHIVKMHVRTARLFDGNYRLFGPAILNLPYGDYELSTRFCICTESNLPNIEIISKEEWDDSMHKIHEIVENTINKRT